MVSWAPVRSLRDWEPVPGDPFGPGQCYPLTPAAVAACQRTANKRSRGPTAVLAIRPLTCNYLVAGAGFEPATSGL
jgi:hypothetical protein